MNNLYVSDLDGTLLNAQKNISDYSIEKINNAIAKGARFTVATARSFVSVMELTEKLNINAPMVLMNGVFIYDRINNKYLKYEQLERENILHLIQILKKHNQGGRMFSFDGEKMIVHTLKNCRYSFPEDVESKYRKIVLTDDLMEHWDKYPVVSFVLIDSFENLKPIFTDIRDNPELSCCFYEDVYRPEVFWLEIYNNKVNKANAVNFVKEYLGAERLTAFGDNINDLEMLEKADEGVCVANGISAAKEKADTVLDLTNDQDAVAKYIDNIFGDKDNG